MKKRFTEEQIVGFLREADKRIALKQLPPRVATRRVYILGTIRPPFNRCCSHLAISRCGSAQHLPLYSLAPPMRMTLR